MAVYTLDQLRKTAPEDVQSLSDEDLLRDYSRHIGLPYERVADYFGVKPSGTLARAGRQFVGGLVAGVPRMAGMAAQAFSEPGRPLYELGTQTREFGERQGLRYEPDLRGLGLLGEAVVKGARGLGEAAPVIGSAFIPGVGLYAAPTAAAALFGGSSYQEAYERVLRDTGDPEAAKAAAMRVGAIHGVGEAGATVATVGLGRAVRPLLPGARTTTEVAEQMTRPGVAAPFARAYATNLAVQPATEVIQDISSEYVQRQYGAAPEDMGGIARESAIGGFGMALLLGPVQFGNAYQRAQRADSLRQALDPASTEPLQTKMQAFELVRAEAQRAGVPEADARQWFDTQIAREGDLIAKQVRLEEAAQRLKSWQDAVAQGDTRTAQSLQDELKTAQWLAPDEQERVQKDFLAAYNQPSGISITATAPDGTPSSRELTMGELLTRRQEQEAGGIDLMGMTGPATGATQQASVLLGGLTQTRAPATTAPTTPRTATGIDLTGRGTPMLLRPESVTTAAPGVYNVPGAPGVMTTELPAPLQPGTTAAPTVGLAAGRTARRALPGNITEVSPGVFQVPETPQQIETGANVPPVNLVSPVSGPSGVTPSAGSPAAVPPAAGVSSTAPTPPTAPVVETKGKKAKKAKVVPAEAPAEGGPANVSDAIKEDAEIENLRKQIEQEDIKADKLFAEVQGATGRAPGRPSLPTQVYAAIRNAILNPKAAIVVRKPKSVERDDALTQQYGEKVKEIAEAIRALGDAYEAYASQNLVRSGEIIKRDETAEGRVAPRAEALQANAAAVQAALARVGRAVDGNAKDVETIVRFVKDRAQKERSNARAEEADILISRAWAAAKRESFIGEPDLLDVSPAEVRQSREATAKGATPQLVDAVNEGYATMGRGAKQTGLNGLLNYIRTSGTPFERTLAQAIKLAVAGKREVKVEFTADGNPRYDPKTNTIFIEPTSSREVALHEALHGALQWFIYNNPAAPQVTALKNALKRVVNYDTAKLTPKAAEVQTVLKRTLAGESPTAELDAVLELISYGNTLNDFRRALQQMESDAPRTFVKFANDVLQTIYALVQRMLGVRQTVARDVIDNTFQLLEAARAAEQTAAPQGNVLRIDTNTSAFKRWFGSSKVVSDDGKPLVVYHGTTKLFDTFSETAKSTSGAYRGKGFYFASADHASDFATIENGNVIPVYLRMENPFVGRLTEKDIATLREQMPEFEQAYQRYLQEEGADAPTPEIERLGVLSGDRNNFIQKALKTAGYDGRIVKFSENDSLTNDDTEFVVFDPTQIKSVFNQGTFDPTTGNILQAAVQTNRDTQAAAGITATDYRNFTKTTMPSLLSWQFAFDALGWQKGATKFSENATKIADRIRQDFPAATRWLTYVNSRFNVAQKPSELMDQFKLDKNTGYSFMEVLVNQVESRPGTEAKAIFDYLDGKRDALDNLPGANKLKMLADKVKDFLNIYIAELPPSDRAFFERTKFSESLLFASRTSQVATHRFGSRDVNELIGMERRGEPSLEGFKAAGWLNTNKDGDVVLDGTFYQVVQKAADSNTITPQGFISSEIFEKNGAPLGFQVDTTRQWRIRKYDRGYQFYSNMTAQQAFAENRVTDLANAMRNTMAALANNYASKNFSSAVATLGQVDNKPTAESIAFDSLDQINEVFGWSPDASQVLKVSEGEARTPLIRNDYRSSNTWVKLPDSKNYGELAGKYMPGPVWSAMTDMSDRQPLVPVRTYNNTMRWFKKSKTVYNPGTHITNIASNITLAMMHDIPLSTIGKATALYTKYQLRPDSLTRAELSLVSEFMSSGAMLGDYSSIEVKQAIYDAWRNNMKPDSDTSLLKRLSAFTGYEKAKAEAGVALAARGVRKIDQIATELYAAEDNVFRLAAFMKKVGELQERDKAATPSEQNIKDGAKFAREAFLDYDIDSKAVRVLRQSVMPFVSWTYAIMPVLGRIALYQPWKLVNVLTAYYLLDVALSAMAGGDDEEARKKGPEWVRDRMFGVGPYMNIRIPFMGDDQNPVYYRLGDYVPLASSTKGLPNGFMGQSWIPQALTPGGPFVSAILGWVGGVDPYTGKDIHKKTDTDFDKLWNITKFTYDLAMPPAVSSRQITKVQDIMDEKRGVTGVLPSGLPLARSFGMKFYDYNVAESEAVQSMVAKRIEREFKDEIRKLRRDEMRRGTPDFEGLNDAIQRLEKRMRDEITKARGGEREE